MTEVDGSDVSDPREEDFELRSLSAEDEAPEEDLDEEVAQEDEERLFPDDDDEEEWREKLEETRQRRRLLSEAAREDEQFCEVLPDEGGELVPRSSMWSAGNSHRLSRRSLLNAATSPVWQGRPRGGGDFYDREPSRKVLYPPERPHPIIDFFTILSAIMVAALAAYYSIGADTGRR